MGSVTRSSLPSSPTSKFKLSKLVAQVPLTTHHLRPMFSLQLLDIKSASYRLTLSSISREALQARSSTSLSSATRSGISPAHTFLPGRSKRPVNILRASLSPSIVSRLHSQPRYHIFSPPSRTMRSRASAARSRSETSAAPSALVRLQTLLRRLVGY